LPNKKQASTTFDFIFKYSPIFEILSPMHAAVN